jgi:hypothetical protein
MSDKLSCPWPSVEADMMIAEPDMPHRYLYTAKTNKK